MRTRFLLPAIMMLASLSINAQTNERYIEVTGTSEIEIVPDKIHYIIEIREYFEEEFDGKSKPEEYHTKVPLSQIEQKLREDLVEAGIPQDAVRTQEIGDYWRKQGQDFLISKQTSKPFTLGSIKSSTTKSYSLSAKSAKASSPSLASTTVKFSSFR